VTPAESAAAFLAGSEVERVEPPALAGKPLEPETLEALYDERLSRGEVKAIQSGYKDPDRFEKWVALLQARVDWDDPIVLPLGEALYIVRRLTDGELTVRSHAGHDFCGAADNWKLHAPIFVRDSDELLQEVYPRMAHCDPEWMELREFYCPISGRMLETEAVTPGYPVVHDFLPDLEGFYEGWLGRKVP
jgi:acetone carboxylase gamma subunit